MTRLEMPVHDPLDALAATLRHGPSVEALRQVTGSSILHRLERTHFSGRRPIQLVYVQGDQTVLAELQGASCEVEAERIRHSLGKARRGQMAGLDAGAVVADPGAGLVLRRPGLDERLPGLRLLYDPDAARDLVGRIEGRDPGPVTPALMAHRLGKRAVVRLTGADGQTRYARLRTDKSRSGTTAFQRHRALWKATRDDPALALPRPLGEDTDLGVALFAALPGEPPVFEADHGSRACRTVSRAIRRLQSMDLAGLPLHDGSAEARLLAEWHGRLHRVYPDTADALAAPLAAVRSALEDLRVVPAPCHRDLHEGQILIDGNRAGLLDFDTLSLADPALDAGNLMAHLFLAGVVSMRDMAASEAALAEDLPHLPARRLRLWRRAALLRLCMIYAFTDMPAAHQTALRSEASRPHD